MECDQENEFVSVGIEKTTKAAFELLPNKSNQQYEFSVESSVKMCF